MKNSPFIFLQQDKQYTIERIVSFIKSNMPYGGFEIKEDIGVVIINIEFPWWSWKVPGFARNNKSILKSVDRFIERYKCIGIEYKVQYGPFV